MHGLICSSHTIVLPAGVELHMKGEQLTASQALQQCYKELPAEPHTTPYDIYTGPAPLDVTAMCLLCHMLGHYDIKGAIDLAHSFISDTNQGASITSSRGLAVVQSLAKLMWCYFVNRPLCIPSISSIGATASIRYEELDRVKLIRAVTEQDLSLLWLPDHAVKLLLLSGLWEEVTQLPLLLGDWKKAFLLAVAFRETRRCFETCIQALLDDNLEQRLMFYHINNLSLTASPHSDEVISEVAGMLHTAAVCGIDSVLVQLCYKCLEDITNAVCNMEVFVPHGVHLPSPPVYCLQPSVEHGVSSVFGKFLLG